MTKKNHDNQVTIKNRLWKITYYIVSSSILIKNTQKGHEIKNNTKC